MPVPQREALFNAALQAIQRLGGSATILEFDEEVTRSLNLSEADISRPHDERRTELEYRLAWVRTYLKAYGLLNNSQRGVWALTAQGREVEAVDPRDVVQVARARLRRQREEKERNRQPITDSPHTTDILEEVIEPTWREQLQAILLNLSPEAFERLCQRMLRESGFVRVGVTGRTGDGGIDGVGLVRIGGLLSFPVLFQCKRYQGTVGASAIRDFRGAMTGRTDRGLVITTGTFSREAKTEATRDGAPPIDLVDGEQLLDKLKELRLGIRIEMVEEVSVVPDWFHSA